MSSKTTGPSNNSSTLPPFHSSTLPLKRLPSGQVLPELRRMSEQAAQPDKLIIFDCDSTLSAIEGVDELGGLRNADVKKQVEELTNRAMAGEIPIGDVFSRRMELIRPSRAECHRIGDQYIQHAEPHARDVISQLKENGWKVVILSGGFVPVIEPLAQHLGVEHIEAVPLHFDDQDNYQGFDENYPTTRNGGKTEIVRQLKALYNPAYSVMVGDGVSDLEAKPEVNRFIGFGRYAERDKVKANADVFIYSLEHLPSHLQ